MCTAGQRVSLTITGPGPSFLFSSLSSMGHPKMCTAGQRVSLTITGPGPSFIKIFAAFSPFSKDLFILNSSSRIVETLNKPLFLTAPFQQKEKESEKLKLNLELNVFLPTKKDVSRKRALKITNNSFTLHSEHISQFLCFMLHAPCSMLHASCFILHASCFMFYASCFILHVLSIMIYYRSSDTFG